MSTGNSTLDALGAASGAATCSLAIEWALYLVIILLVTGLRSYARASISGRGVAGFGWDDYLVWAAVVWYAILTAEVYVIGVTAVGIANDSMTDEHRAALARDGPGSEEFELRVLGSKVQLAAWISYSMVLWLLKGSLLCFFVVRLTEGIDGAKVRAWVGSVLLISTWLSTVITVLASCRPLNKMWQIYPDPGPVCYAGVSPVLIGVTLAGNILTDVFLISIPLPALMRASLGKVQKISLVSLFSCSSLITAMAVARVVLIVTNSNSNGDGAWALRECFIGMITTNLAPTIPLFRRWLSPWIGQLETTCDRSTKRGTLRASRATKSRSRDNRASGVKLMPPARHTSTDSSEHIMEINGVEMQAYAYTYGRGRNVSSIPAPAARAQAPGRAATGNQDRGDSPTLTALSGEELPDYRLEGRPIRGVHRGLDLGLELRGKEDKE